MNSSGKPIRGVIVPCKLIRKAHSEEVARYPGGEQALQLALMRGQERGARSPHRYSTALHQLKDVVRSGVLGEIKRVQITCYWKRDGQYYTSGSWFGHRERTDDALHTHIAYYIDLLNDLFGCIRSAEARLVDVHQPNAVGDNGFVTFNVSGGGTGCLNFATAAWDSGIENSLSLIAENGSIKVSGDYLNRLDYCHIRNHARPHGTSAG
ncbi:hypothetical protein ACFQ4C_27820 [Larkinella insperata]|uniref:GFO/IDH/MocA-like oxidoreductase domain-containing protein n=1 Tax=Larkinella insperata TaxID=332158 RepID=A0ABW3QB29_9BACT|nr:hypothetical protein [Larkinella insperata]